MIWLIRLGTIFLLSLLQSLSKSSSTSLGLFFPFGEVDLLALRCVEGI